MLLDWLLATSPLLLILVLMVRFRWGAARAGAAGWLTAVVVALLRFGATAEVLAVAQAKAFFLSVDVLLIVWAAYLFYRVTDEAGAIRALSRVLARLTPDRVFQALLVGWAFASFLQGVGGFGVPVAVTAPMLVGLGFPPLTAVVIPSIGHAWAVTFGSLATSFTALVAASGIPGEALAMPAAVLLGAASLACGAMVAHAAGGWQGLRRRAAVTAAMALTMAAAQALIAVRGLWPIASFGGALAGLALGALWARARSRTKSDVGGPDGHDLPLALAGYVLLIAVTLIIQLVRPVRGALDIVLIQPYFAATRTSLGYEVLAGPGKVLAPLRHTGAILLYATLATFALYRFTGRYTPGAATRILSQTMRGVLSSSLGIVAMVSMAMVMAQSGMTETLAQKLAQGAGALFPLASPWIGALGAFITGSNTNSNIVFAMLQRRAAELLGDPVVWILAAQTAGGAIGSVIAPTKLVVGASTGGMAGEEGAVLRALGGYIGLLILGIGLLTWVLT